MKRIEKMSVREKNAMYTFKIIVQIISDSMSENRLEFIYMKYCMSRIIHFMMSYNNSLSTFCLVGNETHLKISINLYLKVKNCCFFKIT